MTGNSTKPVVLDAQGQGRFVVKHEVARRGRGGEQWRIVTNAGAVLLLDVDDLFDLTELLDDFCDEYEDREGT